MKDIVDALEMQIDEYSSFLDLDSGKVESVARQLLGQAEEGDEDEEPELPAWQYDEWELAKRIASSDMFIRLPDSYDVHEWAIMEEFSRSVESREISDDLLGAIHGSGAFRSFKRAIHRHHIEKDWYAFRTEALRQIAIGWCEEHDISYR